MLSYSLEHNIPLNVTTPWTFVYDVNGTLNLVVIIIMLLCPYIVKASTYDIASDPYYVTEVKNQEMLKMAL